MLHCVNLMGMADMITHQPQLREVQPRVDPAEKQLLPSQGTTTSLPLASSSSISSRPSNPVPPVTKKPGPVMPFHPIEPTPSIQSPSYSQNSFCNALCLFVSLLLLAMVLPLHLHVLFSLSLTLDNSVNARYES